MIVLGVDLSAQPRDTAAVRIDFAQCTVEAVPGNLADDELIDLISEADVAGLDVPLGWPIAFVDAVARHHGNAGWHDIDASTVAGRDRLRYRETDRVLHAQGFRPLSPSSDLIGVVAMRAAGLQHRLQGRGMDVDRSGVTGAVVETYPAAALRTGDLKFRGYKGAANTTVRAELVERVIERSGPLGMAVSPVLTGARDHVLDAYLCALVAVAARLGLTTRPEPAQRVAAEVEGWIHVPTSTIEQIVKSALAA